MTFHTKNKTNMHSGMQSRLWHIECYKLFHTRMFWISLIVGMVIVLLNSLYVASPSTAMEEYMAWIEESGTVINPEIYSNTLYNMWIGNEMFTFSFSLFYFLFPMLCILPYGWSLCAEMQDGYLKNIAVRVSRRNYFRVKYWTAFLGGGLAGTIPLVFNFVADAMFLPAIKPDSIYPYYMTMQVDFQGNFFTVHPLLFNLIFLVFSFVYFGLIAGSAAVCAFLVKSRVMTILLPVGIFYTLHYMSSLMPYPDFRYDLSPLYCIHPTAVRYHSNGWILFGYMMLMVLFAIYVGKVKGKETYEIF